MSTYVFTKEELESLRALSDALVGLPCEDITGWATIDLEAYLWPNVPPILHPTVWVGDWVEVRCLVLP